MIGKTLSHYRILDKIGEGGMGVVYLAEDRDLDRKVALKLLSPELTLDRDQLRRFRREAKALAALDHPNIVTVYSVEASDEMHFITMEWVEGSLLGDLLPQEGLPLRRFFELVVPLVEAVAAAHEHGIIHRDLKPANVMVRDDDRVKVLDFGLAKRQVLATDETRVCEADRTLTRKGTILGTVRYMSPEQARGEPVGPLSDVFSLGSILYEMATGHRAFDAEADVSVLHTILTEDPQPPSRLRPACPSELEEIILGCLQKDISRRTPSAKALAERLRGVASRANEQTSVAASPVAASFDAGTPPGLEQQIRFCTTPDSVRIAYASVGEGPPVIKAANWLNHLEHDWHSPVWRHLIEGLAREHELVRYDARGNGLSDWTVDDLSLEAFLADLEAVVDASGLERFALLGISQGCAVSVAYAVRHPERVSRLILHGGFARGSFVRGSKKDADQRQALLMVTRQDWGTANPAFRQLWTSLYLPDGTPEEQEAWNDLQRVTSPENAAAIMESTGRFDVTHLLPQVKVPTLVMHCKGELAIPFSEGETLAQLIPDARFVPLEGRNHLVMRHDPAWPVFFSEMQRFLAEDRV